MPVSDYTPLVQDVANLLITRTKDQYGNETGTFSAVTRPTDTQVTNIINTVIDRVADFIGDDIPPALFDDAKGVVAERAAMQIELDYYPEQVETSRSPYDRLEKMYQDDLAQLGKEVQILNEGGELKAISDVATGKAQGSFPDTTLYPPFGMGTRW